MNGKLSRIVIAAAIFVAIIIIGGVYIVNSRFGYVESAILLLAAIVGAGCYWIGGHTGR